MEEKNLEKAMELLSCLLNGETVHKSEGSYIDLYEAYAGNSQVYEYLHKMLKQMNVELYEYENGLYLTAGENNRVFGFQNSELRKILGVKTNRELYLCYFIIYHVIMAFYSDSVTYNYVEFIHIEDIVKAVDESLKQINDKMELFVENELEENSFRTISLIWNELPAATLEEGMRAAKNSKAGYVKTVFNFLVSQELLTEVQERFYPTMRCRALIEHYYEEHRGRLYEILNKKEEDHAAY